MEELDYYIVSPDRKPDYTVPILIGVAFIIGLFIGAILLPALVPPPVKIVTQCINNTSGLFETTRIARGIP